MKKLIITLVALTLAVMTTKAQEPILEEPRYFDTLSMEAYKDVEPAQFWMSPGTYEEFLQRTDTRIFGVSLKNSVQTIIGTIAAVGGAHKVTLSNELSEEITTLKGKYYNRPAMFHVYYYGDMVTSIAIQMIVDRESYMQIIREYSKVYTELVYCSAPHTPFKDVEITYNNDELLIQLYNTTYTHELYKDYLRNPTASEEVMEAITRARHNYKVERNYSLFGIEVQGHVVPLARKFEQIGFSYDTTYTIHDNRMIVQRLSVPLEDNSDTLVVEIFSCYNSWSVLCIEMYGVKERYKNGRLLHSLVQEYGLEEGPHGEWVIPNKDGVYVLYVNDYEYWILQVANPLNRDINEFQSKF